MLLISIRLLVEIPPLNPQICSAQQVPMWGCRFGAGLSGYNAYYPTLHVKDSYLKIQKKVNKLCRLKNDTGHVHMVVSAIWVNATKWIFSFLRRFFFLLLPTILLPDLTISVTRRVLIRHRNRLSFANTWIPPRFCWLGACWSSY